MTKKTPPAQPQLSPSFARGVPDGDDVERDICGHCGFIHYKNPNIVAGSVTRSDDGRILLCRRAIEPRRGFWTIPGGYLELHESPLEGALREAREEANADLQIKELLAVYTVAHISQVQLIFRAKLLNTPSPGPESLDVRLFHEDEIPREDLAFPTVHWALDHDLSVEKGLAQAPFFNPEGATNTL